MGLAEQAPSLQDPLHDRKTSLASLSQQPETVHISKAGFLWKRAQYKRTWLKRWLVCRKGVFRQGKSPGEVRHPEPRSPCFSATSCPRPQQPQIGLRNTQSQFCVCAGDAACPGGLARGK